MDVTEVGGGGDVWFLFWWGAGMWVVVVNFM